MLPKICLLLLWTCLLYLLLRSITSFGNFTTFSTHYERLFSQIFLLGLDRNLLFFLLICYRAWFLDYWLFYLFIFYLFLNYLCRNYITAVICIYFGINIFLFCVNIHKSGKDNVLPIWHQSLNYKDNLCTTKRKIYKLTNILSPLFRF